MSVGEVEECDPVHTKEEGEEVVFTADVGSIVDANDARPFPTVLLYKILIDIHSHIILFVIFLESLFGDADRFLLHFLSHASI